MLGYASTKAYVNTFTTSLRVLASAYNVDVVSVQPGFLDTKITRVRSVLTQLSVRPMLKKAR